MAGDKGVRERFYWHILCLLNHSKKQNGLKTAYKTLGLLFLSKSFCICSWPFVKISVISFFKNSFQGSKVYFCSFKCVGLESDRQSWELAPPPPDCRNLGKLFYSSIRFLVPKMLRVWQLASPRVSDPKDSKESVTSTKVTQNHVHLTLFFRSQSLMQPKVKGQGIRFYLLKEGRSNNL